MRRFCRPLTKPDIQGQHAELAGTEKLQRIEADSPVNMTQLSIAKGELLADIAAGMY